LCYAVADLNREFPNDDACLDYIKEQRWPNGVTKCGKMRRRTQALSRDRPYAYACDHCGITFTRSKGLCLRGAVLPLKTWFYRMLRDGLYGVR